MFCSSILSPVVVLIRTLIQIARQIVETVCGWVSSTITVIKEVVEEVCSWLPWPFSALCNLVVRLIEVVETVWNWICEEVIRTIFDIIEVVFEYIIYILKWICWVIDWVIRLPNLLLCLTGIRGPRFMGVCVKVLAAADGTEAVPLADVRTMMRDAARILARECNITMVVCNFEVIIRPEYLTTTTCDAGGMFSRFFTWFASRACGCCSTVTVYIVQDIQGARGCAYPGSDWVTVDAAGDGGVVVQEIGHLADLWAHSSDPDNVMTDVAGGTADQLTRAQCCVISSSRFVTITPPCNLFDLASSTIISGIDRSDD